MKYFFVRVNGPTLHDDPCNKECFVDFEPKAFKRGRYSNYLNYCFENDIVRMGWPDTGDLRIKEREGAKANCYTLLTIKPYVRQYLLDFSSIQPGSIILVPNRDKSGDIYVCEVVQAYWYDTSGPYECAHRVGVKWNRDNIGQPVLYKAEQLGIVIGGWWLRAFHEIRDQQVIMKVAAV